MACKTVLIVDDETVSLEYYREAISDMGYRVLTAAAPGAALQLAHDNGIDLMVTDYSMPEMNGLELAAAFRKITPRTPIIMMTAHASVDMFLRARSEGFVEYINKPFRMEEFKRIITIALKGAAGRGASREERRSR